MNAPSSPELATGRYRSYLLYLLMIILAFNFTDRLVLAVVLQDIKVDLHLTDTELGFLSGIAFALFYAAMGLPIARWADRGNRVSIIWLTTALWSVTVALCGLAASFSQLLLIRVGVAVGEAGCIPTANSLIGDYYSRSERPRALARYTLGIPMALGGGYFAAGWLNEWYGWRATFVIIGLPGLLLAVLSRCTLREPRLQAINTQAGGRSMSAVAAEQPSLSAVFRILWSKSAFRYLLLFYALWFFFGYGLTQWQPSFFVRSFGLSSGQLGLWLALVQGAGQFLGTWIGGEWAARYARNNERLQLLFVGLLLAVCALFSMAAYLSHDYRSAFGLLFVGAISISISQGPLLGTIQALVPSNMRAVALALIYLVANLIGMGLGPMAAGALSDSLQLWAGQESLRYSLVLFSPGYLLAAWCLWRASRTVHADVDGLPLHENSPTVDITLPVRKVEGP